ncbi:hypothetical protein CLF_109438 [Clonorchis sinensis]|uniref:Uncharacterized protein n=1 Tax=Clonorchis sinensis TaxID=79923 RepID=G7YJC3_CLOSI|nr:hypothetical protein CLF_109438 [Clonorchis sinensis]
MLGFKTEVCTRENSVSVYPKCEKKLAAGATFKFPVTFAPNEKRIYTDSLSIQINIPGTFQQTALCNYGYKSLHTAEVNLCGIGIYVSVDREEHSKHRCGNEVHVEFPMTIVGCLAEKNVTVENLSQYLFKAHFTESTLKPTHTCYTTETSTIKYLKKFVLVSSQWSSLVVTQWTALTVPLRTRPFDINDLRF